MISSGPREIRLGKTEISLSTVEEEQRQSSGQSDELTGRKKGEGVRSWVKNFEKAELRRCAVSWSKVVKERYLNNRDRCLKNRDRCLVLSKRSDVGPERAR